MNNIVENVLAILEKRNISKKEFAIKLINLEPKVGMKAEPPSTRTIYLYLQGKREIKADIIPYIAEVLDVKEQDLFSYGYEKANIVSDHKEPYGKKHSTLENEAIELFPYIPQVMLESFIKKAKEFKQLSTK